MDARHEEPGDGEELQRLVSDEREVEIAGARAVGVERRAVLPSLAGDGAAPEHDRGAGRRHFPDLRDEPIELRPVAIERETDDIVALRRFGDAALCNLVLR